MELASYAVTFFNSSRTFWRRFMYTLTTSLLVAIRKYARDRITVTAHDENRREVTHNFHPRLLAESGGPLLSACNLGGKTCCLTHLARAGGLSLLPFEGCLFSGVLYECFHLLTHQADQHQGKPCLRQPQYAVPSQLPQLSKPGQLRFYGWSQ